MTMLSARSAFALFWLALLSASVAQSAPPGPVFSETGPDAEAYGASENYQIGTLATRGLQRFMVGSFSHADTLLAHHVVAHGPDTSPLRRPQDELAITYAYRGESHDLTDYLSRNPVTGLLIARNDQILFEHYQYGRTDRDRFTSQSMAKTINAMLVGLAVGDGAIRSIDDTAATYVSELDGTAFGETPIRALLHMASGIEFREAYDGADDISRLARSLFGVGSPGTAASIALFNTRQTPPDTVFHYASIDSELLGLILRRAVGMPVADYLRTRIWEPIGAEADATWIVDRSGQEATYCCLNAVLRDYARFALMLANEGAVGARQVVPRDWVRAATTVAPDDGFLAPLVATPFYGYGYQVWLLPGSRRMFALRGIHGQAIFIDPASKLVMVQTAVRVLPSRDPAAPETVALWGALVRQLAGN